MILLRASSCMSTTNPSNHETGRIQALVEQRLGRRVRDFRVIVQGEGAVLKGRATTYYAKQLAQHLVMGLTSLSIAANQIQVCQKGAEGSL